MEWCKKGARRRALIVIYVIKAQPLDVVGGDGSVYMSMARSVRGIPGQSTILPLFDLPNAHKGLNL